MINSVQEMFEAVVMEEKIIMVFDKMNLYLIWEVVKQSILLSALDIYYHWKFSSPSEFSEL